MRNERMLIIMLGNVCVTATNGAFSSVRRRRYVPLRLGDHRRYLPLQIGTGVGCRLWYDTTRCAFCTVAYRRLRSVAYRCLLLVFAVTRRYSPLLTVTGTRL